ncbi:helix-turn-helix transcriptional regulator [Akkermansia muciniphila]|uniref:helix-turn-helix domain-containing protein n=1 Tax=Akkermansia muciniphila TaxID=239935 RepID=UPI00122F0554|nr:helix-turn-helix transcriptional regulator [Akkermansia muciniphila]
MNEIEKDFFDNTHEKAIVANTKTPPKWCPTEREYREQCGPVKTTFALPDLPTFRDRLSWLMAREGQNQSQAAEYIGVPREMISRYFRHSAIPKKENLEKISELYDVPLEWLGKEKTTIPTVKENPLEVADATPKFQLRANGQYPGAIIKQLVLGLIDDDTYQINMTVEG